MTETYGNAELKEVFEWSKKPRKTKDGYVLYCTEPYAEQMLKLYQLGKFVLPKTGETINAKFVEVNDEYLIFDIGYKDYLRVESNKKELSYTQNLKAGQYVDVLVVEQQESPFFIKGSISAIYEQAIHLGLQSLESTDFVEAKVKELNPAGYDLDILYNGVTIPAFMPNTLAGVNKLHDPSVIVGKTFNVMVESFSDEKGTYIVSRKKYLQSLIPKEIKKLDAETVYTGHVTGTTPFGVFVEFSECLTGMIHKSNINPEFADKIDQIQAGTPVDFYVKEIIKDKIILTQILKESLWDGIKVGQKFKGKVKDNKAFGVLVHLDEETIGLIHTSEVEKFGGKQYSAGQDIQVKVLAVDRLNRKIFLTLGV